MKIFLSAPAIILRLLALGKFGSALADEQVGSLRGAGGPSTVPWKARADECVVPDQGQCNGATHAGCEACAPGSGCVYSSKDISVCLPGYDPVASGCFVDDGHRCGGLGYSGCQRCKVGSECVELSYMNSVCYEEGKVSDETAPVVHNNDLMMVGLWMEGMDPVLDALIVTLKKQQQLHGLSPTSRPPLANDEVRQRISMAYASEAGLRRVQELVKSDASFQKFNSDAASALQDKICTTVQSPSSLASEQVKDCVCGRSGEPFVYCAAALEQELAGHAGTRRLRTNRGAASATPRELASCAVNFGAVAGNASEFVRYARAVSSHAFNMTPEEKGAVGVCAGGQCWVPLLPLPLEAGIGVLACEPLLRNVTAIDPGDARRAAAASHSAATLTARVCLAGTGLLGPLPNAMKYLGVDLCPIEFAGTVRPLVGVLEGTFSASALMLYATGSVMLQYETRTRDGLSLCEGIHCSSDESNADYCAMCAGDILAKVVVGVRSLFFNIETTLAETPRADRCAGTNSSSSSTGQCSSSGQLPLTEESAIERLAGREKGSSVASA